MQKRAAAVLALCALLAGAYHFRAAMPLAELSGAVRPAHLALAACAVPLLALPGFLWLRRRVRVLEREVAQLSRSVESLFRSITDRPRRDRAATPAGRPAVAAARTAPRALAPEPARNDNIVVHAAPAAVDERVENIRLQPIVSVARGEAVAFETHPDAGGGDREATASGERMLVEGALRIARRRLGAMSERLPLHVTVSGALARSDADLDAVGELFGLHAPLARSLVLSLKLDPSADAAQAARRIASRIEAHVRIASEISAGQDDLEALAAAGVSIVKLPAARLLASPAYAAAIVAEAREAGMTVIATGVDADDEAMGLIELGLDLMCGDCFSEPWRLGNDNAAPEAPGLTIQT